MEYIIDNLKRCGYQVRFQVLNSYDFGLPQDRDRVFIVWIRNDLENSQYFSFSQPLGKQPKLYNVIPEIKVSSFTTRALIIYNKQNMIAFSSITKNAIAYYYSI